MRQKAGDLQERGGGKAQAQVGKAGISLFVLQTQQSLFRFLDTGKLIPFDRKMVVVAGQKSGPCLFLWQGKAHIPCPFKYIGLGKPRKGQGGENALFLECP